jgi:hypothetical protein
MSRSISDLPDSQHDVVRNLPLLHPDMLQKEKTSTRARHDWKADANYRVICACQHHAQRERTLWRRSLRVIRKAGANITQRGVALLVGIPLAFGAIGIPLEATSAAHGDERAVIAQMSETAPSFPIFVPHRDAAAAEGLRDLLSVERAKEDFFRHEVPYGGIIYDEARRNGLPPELVAAVVESESDFRPRLVSDANAQGLMQIVPSTGRLMGAEDLFNPKENVAAGTKYLRYLYNRFGDQKMVLAAYNAGEGNIERFGGVPPFAETQSYLRRVSSRAHSYERRVRTRYVASIRLHNSVASVE